MKNGNKCAEKFTKQQIQNFAESLYGNYVPVTLLLQDKSKSLAHVSSFAPF